MTGVGWLLVCADGRHWTLCMSSHLLWSALLGQGGQEVCRFDVRVKVLAVPDLPLSTVPPYQILIFLISTVPPLTKY